MTYIDRLNLFWQFAEAETLSANQIALYMGLLYINNSCFWTEWFSVANSRIEHLTGLKGKTIYNVKNQLKQLNLIDYIETGKNRPCKYRILSTPDFTKQLQSNYKAVTHQLQSNYIASTTLIDIDKEIDIDDSVSLDARASQTKVYQFYEENIGVMTGMIAEELDGYSELLFPEAVIYAIRQAAINNKKSCGYVKAVCKSLLSEGVKTPLDLERRIQEREKQRSVPKKKDAERKEYIHGDRSYSDKDLFPELFE